VSLRVRDYGLGFRVGEPTLGSFGVWGLKAEVFPLGQCGDLRLSVEG